MMLNAVNCRLIQQRRRRLQTKIPTCCSPPAALYWGTRVCTVSERDAATPHTAAATRLDGGELSRLPASAGLLPESPCGDARLAAQQPLQQVVLRHSYGSAYDPGLRPLRKRVRHLLEIGVGDETAGSLNTWREYFPRTPHVQCRCRLSAVRRLRRRASRLATLPRCCLSLTKTV